MDPTTLVTFLFKAPPEARTVELLGSWDNFNQPYRMFNDLRRGKGFWSGCFKFHNIIFDGDRSNWSKPRTGGLKQGGTYWYYYRLDDEIEAYDDFKAYTTGCPLLPGQTVNIIEVPIEVEERPNRSRSASFDVLGTLTSLPSTHTLDPTDKFAALEPPPISKVHDRCISDLALNGRLENNNADSTIDWPAAPPGTASSQNTEKHPAAAPPPFRFYLNSDCTDDRSSTSSRRSSSPISAGGAHSDIVNMYGAESSLVGETGSLSRSAVDISRSYSLSCPDLSHEQLCRCDSVLQSNDHIPFHSANNNAQVLVGDYDQTGSDAPASPTELRIPDWRKIPWLGADVQRPRLFVPANNTPHIRAIETDSSKPRTPLYSSAGPITLETVTEVASPRQSEDQNPEPANNDDAFDLCSPTFSATTLSSTSGGGVNTTYRLSITHSFATSYANNNNSFAADSIESVAERLRLWDSSSSTTNDDHSFLPPPPPPTILEEVDETPSPLPGYALPSEAVQAPQSLGKLSSSGKKSVIGGALPMIDPAGAAETSMADSILSELGYLGSSVG